MAYPEWVESGELCVGCGACCGDVAEAPLTLNDMRRLMEGLNLSLEQAQELTYLEPETRAIYFDMSQGFCRALRITSEGDNTQYQCSIYHHRPDICRDYHCAVLMDLEEYTDKNGEVPQSNIFFEVPEASLKIAAKKATRYMLSQFLWGMKRADLIPAQRKEPSETSLKFFGRQLVQIEPTFPGR